MRRVLLAVALLLALCAPAEAIICTGTGPCTVTVRSSGGADYATLNEALAGEAADLVTAQRLLTISLAEFTDTTTATTGTSYNTNENYYINIVVPVANRHDGTPNGGGYLLSGSGSPMLSILEDYTRVTGLHVVTSAAHAVYINAANVLVDKTLVKGGTRQGLYVDSTSANGTIVQNSLAYRCGRSGFESTSATITFKNCTAAECARNGFSAASGTMTVTNCLAYSNGDGATYFDFLGTMTASYNASDDGTASGTGSVANIDFTNYFADAANNDFHLTANATSVLNAGTSTSMPTDDVDGDTRSGSWDIGFDEYIAAGGTPSAPWWLHIQSSEVIE